MPYTRHYFIRGKHIASAPASLLTVRAELAPPYGEAFFCPLCAEVWALCPVDGQPTHVSHAFCDKHSASDPAYGSWSFGHVYSWEVPGSLWKSYDLTWNNDLPLELLKREFLLVADELIGPYNS